MNREDYINAILAEIDDKAARKEIAAELNAHIDDRIAYYTEAGYSMDYALDKAVGSMGNGGEIGIKLNRLHNDAGIRKSTICLTVLYCLYLTMALFFSRAHEALVYTSFFLLLGTLCGTTTAFLYTRIKAKGCILCGSLFSLSVIPFLLCSGNLKELCETSLAEYVLLYLFPFATAIDITQRLSTLAVFSHILILAFLLINGLFGIIYCFSSGHRGKIDAFRWQKGILYTDLLMLITILAVQAAAVIIGIRYIQ